MNRGGVEDTRLEANARAKGTKKIRGQGQECSRPRPRIKDTNASVFLRKKVLKFFFSVDLQKKNGPEKHFPADLQNFNHSKNNAVIEPRTKGGVACHNFSYFSLLFILSWRPKGGGAMAQCSPQNTPLVLHINVNGIRKKSVSTIHKHIGNETWLTI